MKSSMRFGARHVAMAASVAVLSFASVSSLQAQAPAKLDDPTIVAIFDAANTWDIESGGLGVRRGTTKEVRDFGAMLVRDHTAARKLGRDLATKLHVTPTPPANFPLAAAHTDAMKKLGGLHGKDFDKAFLQHEVDYHTAVIDALNGTLIPAAQNAELKDLATKIVPAFEAHRAAAKALLAKE